jgi:glycerol-3-phosphate dehydrogenase (NAD(P)+)
VKVAIIGAGSWGTAVARLVSVNADDVVLWARDPRTAAQIAATRENEKYLPGFELPGALEITSSLEVACFESDVVVLGVPSHGLRKVLEEAAEHIAPNALIVSLAKGLEQDSDLRMSEVVRDVLGDTVSRRTGVLTGPNLAREVAAGQPTASVVAVPDPAAARLLQSVFMTPTFRVYTNPDVVGCELAGVVKNVIAIAAGIAAGLDFGANTMAALLTRGLAELGRLGTAMGGDPLTFAGLAGMGDLVATCTSPQSRNRTVGVELGKGRSIDEIIADMHMVAEGVKSTRAVVQLARRNGVEMPIAEQVAAVLYEGRRAPELLAALMAREAKPELHGLERA